MIYDVKVVDGISMLDQDGPAQKDGAMTAEELIEELAKLANEVTGDSDAKPV